MRGPLARLFLATLALIGLGAVPALAHAGGRAQLYIASAQLQPAAGGWLLQVDLRDLDSGTPQPGFAVRVAGSGAVGTSRSLEPVMLNDPENDGHYAGTLPLTEGRWSLSVVAAEVPGGNAALPYDRTWDVTVRPGEALNLAGSRPNHRESGSGAGMAPLLLAVAGTVALFGLGRLRIRCRR